MLDARRPLNDLNAEWSQCTKCELGVRRKQIGSQFVYGEGKTNAIMFIGEGPGRWEEAEGRPFVGKSGELLRGIIEAYGITDYYITNIVTCRACEVVMDETTGMPRMYKRRGQPDEIAYRDVPPLPSQLAACAPRVYEEIYLVDPVIIVALGVSAASFLLNRAVSITKDRGRTEPCLIPGVTGKPVLTETRKAWVRKVRGEWVAPVEQNQVKYLVLPTLHPAFVLRKEGDHGRDSPFNQLAADVKLAADIYEKYMFEFFGREPMLEDKELNEQEVRHHGDHEEEEDGQHQ